MKRKNIGFSCLAKRLRRDQTEAERKLWMQLRGRRLHGFKFRRQHPIGNFIVDFCCPERCLVIELDGGHHLERAQADRHRTDVLTRLGYSVVRFWGHEVLTALDAVLDQIAEAVKAPSPSPLPPQGGEGKMKGRKKCGGTGVTHL